MRNGILEKNMREEVEDDLKMENFVQFLVE
jgi:hypothetical protein